MYATSVHLPEKKDEAVFSAYAVYRPDGLWSLLLVNKDPRNEYRLRIRFDLKSKEVLRSFAGESDLFQFSRKDYQLSDDRDKPVVIKSDPPEHSVLTNHDAAFIAPPYSITVVRGIGPKP